MKPNQHSQSSYRQLVKLPKIYDLVPLPDKYGLSTGVFEQQRQCRAAVAALPEATIPASVSQLMGTVQKFSSTLDTVRASIPPIHPFDGLSKDLRFLMDRAAVAALPEAAIPASVSQFMGTVQKFSGTFDAIRASVSPIYRTDWLSKSPIMPLAPAPDAREREWDEHSEEPNIEPSVDGTISEGDLARELRQSCLPDAKNIVRVLEYSANHFHDGDFNGCLNNARVALQTLAKSIAQARLSNHAGNFNPAKWGEVIAYLRKSGFITEEQERGISGLFGFLSPGSHTPIPIGEEEFARLGRTLAVSICYFLVKQFNAIEADS